MANDPVSAVSLTPEQARFLAKYLQYVPKKKKLRAATFAENESVKKAFVQFEKVRGEVYGLLSQVEAALSAAQVKHSVFIATTGAGDPTFQAAFDTEKQAMDAARAKAGEQVRIAQTAKEDAPKFAECAAALDLILQDLTALRSRVPTPPPAATAGTGHISACLDEVGELKRFADVKEFTFASAQTLLADPVHEAKRKSRLADHDALCDDTARKISDLLNKVTGRSAATVAKACDTADALVLKLRKDRAEKIRSLAFHLNATAMTEMDELAKDGDPLAEREVFRSKEIAKARKQMLKAVTSLKTEIAEKKARLDAAPDPAKGEEPMGFGQKQALLAEIAQLEDRRAEILERSQQMRQYRRSTGARLDAIQQSAKDMDTARGFLDGDGVAAMKAAARAQNLRWPPQSIPSENKALLQGERGEDGTFAGGRLQNLREKFARSHERISVDARMFPNEKDLTDINDEQHKLLDRMLTKANAMVNQDRLGEADFLMTEADKLWLKFVGANKFSLPERSEAPPNARERVDAAIRDVTVLLDRFWGQGGDADGSLRTELTRIRDELAKPKKAMPFIEAESALSLLEARILEAMSTFQPAAADAAARTKAADTQNKLTAELAKLYKTKVVAEKDIASVPRDMLLTVKGDGGAVTYYQILAKQEETVERRDDKDIPRETLAQLYEQASTLELLAASSAPDCADAIAAAVDRAAKLLKNVQDGGPDYKYVAEQIKKVAAIVPKDGAPWVPTGLVDAKTEFEDFKKTYTTRLTAAKARTEIDRLHQAFVTLGKAAKDLEAEHKRVGAVLDALEKDLSDGRGASKGNPAEVLKKMVKDGPEKLLKEVISAPLSKQDKDKWDALVAALKADIVALKDAGKDGKSLEGDLTKRIRAARQSLDTRSEAGIARAETAAQDIRADMDKMLGELDPANASLGMPYLASLAAFLKGAREGAGHAATLRSEIKEVKAAIDKALGKAKASLDSHGDSLKTHNEYLNVYQSIKKQAENTTKSFDKSDDAEWALSQYKLQKSSAEELRKELEDLTVVSTSKTISVDMKAWQEALDTNIGKVASAAEAAAKALLSKATEDTVQAQDKTLQDAATAAAAALRQADEAHGKRLVRMKPAVTKAVADAVAEADSDKRRDLLATARELALADVRRIRSVTDSDPFLKIYRENPFDEGLHWAQFIATLHGLEVKILKQLKPV